MADVRSKLGAPILDDFNSSSGTPIVVNQTTGESFVLLADNTIMPIPASQARIKSDIINGQFRIAQRGTSFVSPASAAYDLDRWRISYTSTALVTVAQVAGSSTGKFARQVTVNTADTSIAAGDIFVDQQLIEGYRIVKYIGNTFTLAFRAKVPVIGIHCVSFRNTGNDRSYVAEINFPSANVWQDCSITVTGGLPTAGTWNYTTGIGLRVQFAHACGSTFQTTANAWQTGFYDGTANQVNDLATIGNVWAMEDVRMCLGTYCPPDDKSYEEDLEECQRYLPVFPMPLIHMYATGAITVYVQPQHRVTTRVPPTGATLVSAPTYNNSSNLAFNTASIYSTRFSLSATGIGIVYCYDGSIMLTGCEL